MASADRVIALEAALRRLSMIVDGVTASVVVSEDGLALAAYPNSEDGSGREGIVSTAQVAAVSATLAALAERSLDRLAQGELGRLLLEGEAGTLLSCPAGDVTLALLVEKEASMGHVLFAAQKAAAEIEAILATR
ncbi:MAG: roadblock/LC7 domain-containing protein [Chloroflexota bacterium]|nr:roadblock/LC7 domain-containing protein [Chloroflexota bacterium]